MHVVLAPHLDDEIIGCYSVLDKVDLVLYFSVDYRADQNQDQRPGRILYVPAGEWSLPQITTHDTVYIPSQFDYHPLHRKVRRVGLSLPGHKMFYSVEMNTPWLEEEADPEGKRNLFEKMYPGEVATISKSDKYFLFKSIQPFDSVIWASVRFTKPFIHHWPDAPEEVSFLAHPHRHLFHFQVDVQQFDGDREIEYLQLSSRVQTWFKTQIWGSSTSCEGFASRIKLWLETVYVDRKVRVSVYEDGENGVVLE